MSQEVRLVSGLRCVSFSGRAVVRELAATAAAVILLMAASLKMAQLSQEVFWFWSYLSPLRIALRVGICAVEVGFAVWLVTAKRSGSVAAFRCTAVLFLLLAIASGAQSVAGIRHCGCFGEMTVSPSVVMVVDLATCFLLLVLSRVKTPMESVPYRQSAVLVSTVMVAVLVSASVAGIAQSRRRSVAVFRGPLLASQSSERGSVVSIAVPVFSTGTQPVRLVGARGGCGVRVRLPNNSPIELGTGKRSRLLVEAVIPPGRSAATVSFELYVATTLVTRIPVRIDIVRSRNAPFDASRSRVMLEIPLSFREKQGDVKWSRN